MVQLTGGIFNLPAAGIILVLTGILVRGTTESTRFNNIIVAIKTTVVLLVIFLAQTTLIRIIGRPSFLKILGSLASMDGLGSRAVRRLFSSPILVLTLFQPRRKKHIRPNAMCQSAYLAP